MLNVDINMRKDIEESIMTQYLGKLIKTEVKFMV